MVVTALTICRNSNILYLASSGRQAVTLRINTSGISPATFTFLTNVVVLSAVHIP